MSIYMRLHRMLLKKDVMDLFGRRVDSFGIVFNWLQKTWRNFWQYFCFCSCNSDRAWTRQQSTTRYTESPLHPVDRFLCLEYIEKTCLQESRNMPVASRQSWARGTPPPSGTFWKATCTRPTTRSPSVSSLAQSRSVLFLQRPTRSTTTLWRNCSPSEASGYKGGSSTVIGSHCFLQIVHIV